MSASKTILVAHRQAAVRDRFAAALADARHSYVLAESSVSAIALVRDQPISLALVDAGLADAPAAFVADLKRTGGRPAPVVVFAASVPTAAVARELSAAGIAGYMNEFAATSQILPALAPYLFPDSFDRRSSPRIAVGLPVSFRAGQTIAGALTLNIGKGGIGIRTMSPLGAGTPVHVKFTLPGSADAIEASGSVAWSDSRLGMGVRFDDIDAAAQAAIDRFVDERA